MENKRKCDCESIHEYEASCAKAALKEAVGINHLADFFKAFADDTRLRIMCVLDSVGRMCVCDIAYALNMTKSAISHQLKYLKNANLIRAEKFGKEVFYMLADNHVKTVYEMGLEHVKENNL